MKYDMFNINDIVVFNVTNLHDSATNNHAQTIRGAVLSFGVDIIEIDNFDRLSEKYARKDSSGRARRKYRYDSIVGGREGISVVYSP